MGKFKEFIKRSYKDYLIQLQNLDVPLEEIGRVKGQAIYKIHFQGPGKTICVSAGVHGNEPACPYAIIDWLRTTPTQNVLVFPLVNPYGFEKNIRRGSDNLDLNRHFRHEVKGAENKIILNEIKKHKVRILYSMHEHPSVRGFYVYSSGVAKDTIDDLLNLGREHGFKIRGKHNGQKIDGNVRLNKLDGDNSLEDWMFTQGIPYITFETPGTASLKTRVALQADLLRKLID